MTLHSARSQVVLVTVFVSLFVLSFSGRASAYAWMIRHEYAGCNTCHADPSGGGLLTAYGRALGENELTMQWGKLLGGKGGHTASGGHGPSSSEEAESPEEDEDEVKPILRPAPKPAAKPALPGKSDKKGDKKGANKSGAKTAKPADDEEDDETPVVKRKKGGDKSAESAKASPSPEPAAAAKPAEEEDDSMNPGRGAKFLWGLLPLPDSILLGGDLRSAYVKMSTNSSGHKSTLPFKFYMMQADLEGQFTYSRFRVNGSFGYDGTGLAQAADITRWETHNLVSRTHWIGADLGADNEWLLRFGRMNLPWGIRSIEHELWIKSVTQTDINQNQQDGLALSYNVSGIRGEVMGIIGNLQESPDRYRQRGYSFYGEYAPINRFAVGIDSMVTHVADDSSLGGLASWRHAHGAFARYSPHEMLYFSVESAYVYYSTPKASAGGYIESLQADFEPVLGLHFEGTFELSNMPGSPSTQHFDKPAFNYVGTVAWFFAPHADLRLDATESSLPPPSQGAGGSLMTTLVAQLHLYL